MEEFLSARTDTFSPYIQNFTCRPERICDHEWKEYLVNLKLYKQCTKCDKKIHIKDLKHWVYKKKRINP